MLSISYLVARGQTVRGGIPLPARMSSNHPRVYCFFPESLPRTSSDDKPAISGREQKYDNYKIFKKFAVHIKSILDVRSNSGNIPVHVSVQGKTFSKTKLSLVNELHVKHKIPPSKLSYHNDKKASGWVRCFRGNTGFKTGVGNYMDNGQML